MSMNVIMVLLLMIGFVIVALSWFVIVQIILWFIGG